MCAREYLYLCVCVFRSFHLGGCAKAIKIIKWYEFKRLQGFSMHNLSAHSQCAQWTWLNSIQLAQSTYIRTNNRLSLSLLLPLPAMSAYVLCMLPFDAVTALLSKAQLFILKCSTFSLLTHNSKKERQKKNEWKHQQQHIHACIISLTKKENFELNVLSCVFHRQILRDGECYSSISSSSTSTK